MVIESGTAVALFRRKGGRAADGNVREREGRRERGGEEEKGEGLRVICSRSIFRFNAAAPESSPVWSWPKKRTTVAEPIWAALPASRKRFRHLVEKGKGVAGREI